MKNVLFVFSFILSATIYAQNSTGEVKYLETIKLNLDLPEGNEALNSSIPTSQSILKSLVFNGNESYYKDDGVNEDLNINQQKDGMDMQIVMKNPENTIYTNKEKNLMIQSREFMGKFFLINGELNLKKWKITDEQKNILGYRCQKAVLVDTAQDIVVWYSSEFPVQCGPNGIGLLPGLILRVEIDKDARVIMASKVDIRELKNGEIIKPSKGKKMSLSEFNAMQEAKMKEMGMVKGKGGAVKMIIREERH